MDDINRKAWYQSRGVIGGVIAVAASVASIWGFEVSAADQSELVNYALAAGGAFGGILAVIGRLGAKKVIV